MMRKRFMGYPNIKVENIYFIIIIYKLEKLQLVEILQFFLSKTKS